MIREPKLDVHPLSIEDAYLFVRTRDSTLVNKVFSFLEDPTLFFHKVYSFIGTFGSGKTTIINYIRYNFHRKSIKVRSLDLEWKPIVSKISGPHEIRNWFIEEMQAELLQACDGAMLTALLDQKEDLKMVANRLASKEDLNEKQIIEHIKVLCRYYDGFTILLDELHRVSEYQHVLDFLKFEQSFFQNVCKHPVAIFVACSDEWEKNLQLREYSGIFDEFVHLPQWTNAREAYELLDKRLRDAAADPSKFNNPLSRNALNKIANMPNVKTPRDWIKYAKRIFDNLPEDVSRITPSVVGKAISFVDVSTVDKIRNLARFRFAAADKFIKMVLRRPTSEASGLLNVIAHIYHQPLPRPLNEKVLESIDIENFPMLLETLKELKIVIKDTQSSPPIKSKWRVVEIHRRKIYRLNPKLTEFFRKVENQWGLDPEDYVLSFVETETVTREMEKSREDEQNLKRMKLIANNLEMPRAKDHILRAIEDYEAFISTVFSTSPIDRATLRSGIMTMYNIIAAFNVEKTKDAKHSVDMNKDLERLQKVLMPGESLVKAVANLFREFKEIEDTGKPLTEEISSTIKTQVPEIINRLITQLDRWTSLPSTTRDHKEMLERMQAIEAKIARPQSLVRVSTIDYLKTLAEHRGIKRIDEKWLEAFFKMLEQRGVDKALMEIVEIRCNPKLYHQEKTQAYKNALLKLGLAFEDMLVIIGRNHADSKVQKTFGRARLNIKYMLTRLFEKDEVLKTVLSSYSDFDRSKDTKDFEKKVQELLGKEGDELPPYARYYALTTLVRNYYSHDGCQDTTANTDEQLFIRILNEGLCSALSLFKFLADRDKIIGFKV